MSSHLFLEHRYFSLALYYTIVALKLNFNHLFCLLNMHKSVDMDSVF